MRSQVFTRIVPVSMCLCAVSLPGCDRADTSTTAVKASNTQPAQPAASEAPAEAASATPPLTATQPNTAATKSDSAALTLRDTAPSHPDLTGTKAAAPAQQPMLATLVVKADPPEVDLGDIPTNDSKSGKVRLVNTGETPMTVINARASCGCTTLKFTPNTVIPPHGDLEVDVQMTGGNKPGPIHGKIVTFVVEGQPEVVVPLKGQAVSFVVSDPATLDPEKMPEGKFVLRSIDNTPFGIMSVAPAVIETDKEKRTEHELVVSWDKYRELGANKQLMIYLDHPKCNQVFMNVAWKPEELLAAIKKDQQQRQVNQGAITKGSVPGNEPAAPPAPTPVQDPDAVLAELIKNGQNVEVMQRLQSGLDPNYRDNSGNSLLGMAAKSGNVDLMKALLATDKVELNSTDNVGRTPLMHAATSKNAEAVRLLLDAGVDITTRDNLGNTALSWGAWLGNAQTVQELLDKGSDVEIVSTITGWTPLMLAAAFGEPGAVEALIKAHANLESADMLEGATPLIHAARTGQPESLRLLIKAGANLEMPDRNGLTPLLSCAKNSGGDAEKLKILIDAGANIRAKDNRGLNALDLARKRADMRAADVIKILEPLLAAETPAAASSEPKPAGS